MLDIGWQEIFIIGVLALIVVGPKDLPRVLKTATQFIGKARGLAREFQNGVNEVVREADLDDLKKQVDEQKWNVDKALETALDKDGLDEQLDLDDGAAGLELEEDYQARKKAAEEKARKQVAGDDGPEAIPEPADHELDGGDDDEPEPELAESSGWEKESVPETEPATPAAADKAEKP